MFIEATKYDDKYNLKTNVITTTELREKDIELESRLETVEDVIPPDTYLQDNYLIAKKELTQTLKNYVDNCNKLADQLSCTFSDTYSSSLKTEISDLKISQNNKVSGTISSINSESIGVANASNNIKAQAETATNEITATGSTTGINKLQATTKNILSSPITEFIVNDEVKAFIDSEGLHSNIVGVSASATKLETKRTINGTLFDGTENITTECWGTERQITLQDNDGSNSTNVNTNGGSDFTIKLPSTIKASLTGNATSATKLETSRTINGTLFNGTENITTECWGTERQITLQDNDGSNSTNVSTNGGSDFTIKLPSTIKASLTGNADTTTKLETKRTINGTSFDGTENIITECWGTERQITLQDSDGSNSTNVNTNGGSDFIIKLPPTIKASLTGTADYATTLTNTPTIQIGSDTNKITITAGEKTSDEFTVPYSINSTCFDGKTYEQVKNNLLSDNSASATKLETKRTINGTSFDGTENITTECWGTERKITLQDNDGSNSTNVNTNGGSDFTIKLPSTIKASLTGNADTATNSTCFDGCTYTQAKTDILAGKSCTSCLADCSKKVITPAVSDDKKYFITLSDGTSASTYNNLKTSSTKELTYNPNLGKLVVPIVEATSCVTVPDLNVSNTITGKTINAKTINVEENVNITGNLNVTGKAVITHTEEVVTPSENIILREEATTAISPGKYSGLIVSNYDGNNNNLEVGVDKEGTLKIGTCSDDMEAVATRDCSNNMENNYVAKWNSTDKNLVTNGTSCTHDLCVNGTLSVSGGITGGVTGNASTASKICVSLKSDSVNYPLIFTEYQATPSAGNKSILQDSANNLYYNPSTNTLQTTNIYGSTSVKSPLLSTLDPSANQTNNLTFTAKCKNASTITSFSMCLCGSDGILYNPKGFNGNLTGNAATATNSTCFGGKTYAQTKADILTGNAATATTATNSTCFNGKTYTQAKTDILTGNAATATTATNSTCFGGKTYAQAKTDILAGNAATATNSTCFGGCTYAQAKADIQSGLTGCEGTVTSVNVKVNGVTGTAITSSGTIELNCVKPPIDVTNLTASATYYPTLSATNTAGYKVIYTDANYKFDPYTNKLTTCCAELTTALKSTGDTEIKKIYSIFKEDMTTASTVYDLNLYVRKGTCTSCTTYNTKICGNDGILYRNTTGTTWCPYLLNCDTAANSTCFGGKTYTQAKTDILTGNAATATNSTCFGGKTYTQAKTDILSGNAATATNSTCFGGKTYAQAKADIQSGLTGCKGTVISIKLGETSCTADASGVVSLPAYPDITGLTSCKGTVISIKLGETSCTANASGVVSLPAYPDVSNFITMDDVDECGYTTCTGTVKSIQIGTNAVCSPDTNGKVTIAVANDTALNYLI